MKLMWLNWNLVSQTVFQRSWSLMMPNARLRTRSQSWIGSLILPSLSSSASRGQRIVDGIILGLILQLHLAWPIVLLSWSTVSSHRRILSSLWVLNVASLRALTRLLLPRMLWQLLLNLHLVLILHRLLRRIPLNRLISRLVCTSAVLIRIVSHFKSKIN